MNPNPSRTEKIQTTSEANLVLKALQVPNAPAEITLMGAVGVSHAFGVVDAKAK